MAALRAHGRAFTPDVIAAQRRLIALALGDIRAPHVRRDVAYGPDVRQRLDLHAREPLAPGGARPVVLFVHGGGFSGGDKSDPELPFFDDVGAWAAERGWIGATMTYRRAPEHAWPAGSRDVAAAVERLSAGAAEIGADPDRIVLFGHSAGAAHVAGFLAGHGGPTAAAPACAILQSGIYDPAAAEDEIAAMVALYYGDAAERPARATLPALAATRVPLLLGAAEFDPASFQRQTAAALAAILRERGSLPLAQVAQGHSHVTPVLALGTGDTYGAVVAGFIRRAVGEDAPADEGTHA
ncbi:alpha/beta hydrolase [Microbacterium paludicola]|uniref:alpha/beta hydrolase n=1 Tax=Microbacterium paludicola TaxID=300019 RepID=UPI0031D33D6E